VWSAWGWRGDYYIGARSVLGSMKVSLHASGICRLALTERHFAALTERGLIPPEERAIVKWRRPPAPEVGAMLAVVLVFPTKYMTLGAPSASLRKPILVFETAKPGMAVEVGFFYSRESATTLEPRLLEIGKPIFYSDLAEGESVWIVVRETDFDPTIIPSADQLSSSRGHFLESDFPIGVERRNLSAMLWNSPKDGKSLRIIEISGVSATRNITFPYAPR